MPKQYHAHVQKILNREKPRPEYMPIFVSDDNGRRTETDEENKLVWIYNAETNEL